MRVPCEPACVEARRHAPMSTPVMTGLSQHDGTLVGVGATLGPAQFGEFANALPPGTRLHEFEILSVVGQGGFGIVYLAHDLTLDRKVAIKEYMPTSLATRTRALTVAVHSNQHTETFAAGLRSFVNEARLLARFDHPSLLKVHRFWEAHGTAYMVMPYYEGITLGKMLARLGAPPAETTLKELLDPLLDALELMHAGQCFHRDIAPDNILILPDGRPLLLDFGAARRVIGDMTQALTVILKTGYAPVEQYGDIPEMSQGAWTDLYALGSVVQFAITGRTPPQALTRFMDDRRELLAVVGAGRYSDTFLRAIDQSLAVLPKNRPQSVAELRALMGNWLFADAPSVANVQVAPASERQVHAAPPEPVVHTQPTTRHDVHSAPVTEFIVPSPVELHADIPLEPLQAHAPAPAAKSSGRSAVVAGGVALLVVAAAAFAWWTAERRQVADPVAAAAPSLAPPPAPILTPTTDAPAAAPPASAPAVAIVAPVATVPLPGLAPAAAPATQQPSPAQTPEPAPPPGTALQEQPAQATETPARAAEPSRPPKTPPARSSVAAAPDTAKVQQHKSGRTLSSGRCADIIQRVSIGEEPSDADKTFLKQECGR